MESIRCNCSQCGSRLCNCVNLWSQVGKSYCAPLIQPSGPIQMHHRGKERQGDPQTLVDGCTLQDIVCSACEAVVGLRCLSTPLNHVLDHGQILFRLNSVQAASLRGAKKAEFTIKRTLQLRKLPERPEEGLPKPSFSARYSQGADEMPIDAEPVHLSQVQASIENNRKDIDRIDTAGFQIVSALDKAVRRVENETSKLQKSVQDLRKLSEGSNDDIMFLKTELNNIGMTAGNAATESISRFETQVHSISDAVPALREELKAYSTQSRKDIRRLDSQLSQAKQEIEQLKGINKSDALAVKEHAKELKSLRAEMLTLRDSLDQPSASQPLEKPMGFPRKELDILTDNIARLGNRASQVETLQMQLEILKGRVERVETEKLNASMTTIHPSNHKKRPRYDVQQSELSTEIGMLPRDGPLEVSDVKGPRLMRSGAMDRRTEKRISKRS